MDTADGISPQIDHAMLSYDDTVAYEEQLPTEDEQASAVIGADSLLNRISNSKVYLLSESASAISRTTKRKYDIGDGGPEEIKDDDEEETTDDTYRNNAVLFNGEPISHLPTARLFAYATHFDAHPMGLEWVDDQTCIFVFSSTKDAREAFTKLTKPITTAANPVAESGFDNATPMFVDDPVDVDYTPARPLPVALWPAEKRINQSLGQGRGLKGPIRMRWARMDDIKQKGAKNMSMFYKKHGSSAGKELFNGRDLPPSQLSKRKRHESFVDEESRREELDKELEEFLAQDDVIPDTGDTDTGRRKHTRHRSRSPTLSQTPSSNGRRSSPPSKMRSDYISQDGRTLLERTSPLRFHPLGSDPLEDSTRRRNRRRGGRGKTGEVITSGADPLPLDYRGHYDGDGNNRRWDGGRDPARRGPKRRRNGEDRPVKSQQELDDELDAFLNGKD